MAKYPTPHINAAPDDFGKTVLMPGDPKRSAYIAKNFFEEKRFFKAGNIVVLNILVTYSHKSQNIFYPLMYFIYQPN